MALDPDLDLDLGTLDGWRSLKARTC